MRQTKKQRHGEKKEERGRESGVSLSRETVPSVDTGEGRYNAATAHI